MMTALYGAQFEALYIHSDAAIKYLLEINKTERTTKKGHIHRDFNGSTEI